MSSDPSAREELLAALASLDPAASTAAAEALARHGDPGDFGAVWASVLRDCGLEYVLEDKARAAARLAGPAGTATLIAAVESVDAELERLDSAPEDGAMEDGGDLADEVLRTQDAAVLALQALGEAALAPVLDVLERGGPLARGRGAGRVLRALADPRAGASLVRALGREDDPFAASFLLGALGACDPEAGEASFRAWLRPPPGVNAGFAVEAAGAALVGLRGDDALPDLLDVAADPDPEIRRGAVAALSRLDLPGAREALERRVLDDHPRVAAAARRALATMSGP